MPCRTKPLDEWLLTKLRDADFAREYLVGHFTDDGQGDFEHMQVVALRAVAKARGYALVPLNEVSHGPG